MLGLGLSMLYSNSPNMSECDLGEIIIELWRGQFGYKNHICLRSNFDHYVHAISKREVVDHY